MKIRVETVRQTDGSKNYDLVLRQGEQQIRLGLTTLGKAMAESRADDLAAWIDENTTADCVLVKGGAA